MTTLENIKASLIWHFGSKAFDAEGMLKDLAKGEPIARGDSMGIRTCLIELEGKFDLARGKGWRTFLNGKVYI
jgi:hypothetical protein